MIFFEEKSSNPLLEKPESMTIMVFWLSAFVLCRVPAESVIADSVSISGVFAVAVAISARICFVLLSAICFFFALSIFFPGGLIL